MSVFSEMGVLRQKLTEREEERGQLERQVTELSATVSSTLASYAFLEQALAAETTKYEPPNILRITNICSGTILSSISKQHGVHANISCCFRLQQSWKDIHSAKERADE